MLFISTIEGSSFVYQCPMTTLGWIASINFLNFFATWYFVETIYCQSSAEQSNFEKKMIKYFISTHNNIL